MKVFGSVNRVVLYTDFRIKKELILIDIAKKCSLDVSIYSVFNIDNSAGLHIINFIVWFVHCTFEDFKKFIRI